jgi:hypothetical protein
VDHVLGAQAERRRQAPRAPTGTARQQAVDAGPADAAEGVEEVTEIELIRRMDDRIMAMERKLNASCHEVEQASG